MRFSHDSMTGPDSHTRRNRWAAGALLTLALAGFVAHVLWVSQSKLQPRYDEVEYLSMARDYAREGGLGAVVACYWEGRCKADNRHPLYQFALAAISDDGPTFYARAKLLNLATALVLLALLAWIAWRRFGPAAGVATFVVASMLSMWAELSAGVLCDVLLAVLVSATVYWIGRAQDAQGPKAAIGAWALVGALVGVAWLNKGNGHILLAAAFLTGLHTQRLRLFTRPGIYVATLMFLGVASFLIVRNLKVYGTPFHNVNAKALWLDAWHEIWTKSLDPEWNDIGLRWYLERHSIGELLIRMTKGFGETAAVFTYTAGVGPSAALPGIGPLTPLILVLRSASGFAVAALGVWGLVRRYRMGHKAEVLAVSYTLLLFFGAFSLGAQGVGEIGTRFVLPLVALVVPYAAWVLVDRVGPWFAAKLPASQRAHARNWAIGLTGLLLLTKLAMFGSGLSRDPMSLYDVPKEWSETTTFLAQRLGQKDRYALSSNSLFSQWNDPRPRPDARWLYDYAAPKATFDKHATEQEIRTLLVDAADPDLPKWEDKLSPERDAHGPLRFLDWQRCFATSAAPSRFLVYCRP